MVSAAACVVDSRSEAAMSKMLARTQIAAVFLFFFIVAMIDSSLFSGWDVLELFFHLLSIEFGFQEYYGCFAKEDGIGLSE